MHSASVCELSRGQVKISTPKSCAHQQCLLQVMHIMQSGLFFSFLFLLLISSMSYLHILIFSRFDRCIYPKWLQCNCINTRNMHHFLCTCVPRPIYISQHLKCIKKSFTILVKSDVDYVAGFCSWQDPHKHPCEVVIIICITKHRFS